MPRSPSPRRRPMSPIRPSPKCPSRPIMSRASARSSPRAAAARRTSRKSGPRIIRSPLVKALGKRSSKPTAPASSAGGSASGSPAAAIDGRLLSRSTGAVLDPVFVLRRRVSLAPGAAAHIDFWTLVAEFREKLLDAIDRTNDISAFERAVTLAWTQAQVQLHHLGIDREEASRIPASRRASHLCRAVAAAVLGSDHARRRTAVRLSGRRASRATCRSSCCASRTSRTSGSFTSCCRPWNIGGPAGSRWTSSSSTNGLPPTFRTCNPRSRHTLRTRQARPPASAEGATGQVFLLRADLLPPETPALLASVARVRLTGDGRRACRAAQSHQGACPSRRARQASLPSGARSRRSPVANSNFSTGSADLRKRAGNMSSPSAPASRLPRPGSTSLPIPGFGFQVSAEGCGFTWSVNSREHQLTPWSNDPVTDRPGEAIYLRDEESGELWCPTALAHSRRSRRLCRAARLGLQPVRA